VTSVRKRGRLAKVPGRIPDAVRHWRHLRPSISMETVRALTPSLVRRLGVQGIVWTVDGTLMPCSGDSIAVGLAPAYEALRRQPGLRHLVLADGGGEARFEQVAAIFPDLPVLRSYRSGGRLFVRRRRGSEERWYAWPQPDQRDSGASGNAGVPAEGATGDIAAPPGARPLHRVTAQLIGFALRELECEVAARAVMIGCRYFAEIGPANAAGLQTIRVETVEPESFPAAERIVRRAEEVIFGGARSR
jgi:predicted HAD superfamily phosphohydrolase YqeG